MAETSGSRRRLVEASTLGVGVVLAVLLLGFVNYFGWKYHLRFDWTAARLYSLSEKSLNVARSLGRDIDVVVFASPEASLSAPVRELLSRYQAASSRIRVRELDPVENLLEAQRLLEQYDTGYQTGTLKVVFDAGDGQRRVFEEADLAEFDYASFDPFTNEPPLESLKAEEAFTGALIELAAGERTKILFTTGHGEKRLDDAAGSGLRGARELLARGNVEVEEWASLGQPAVPEGTGLLVVAGPTAPFAAPELGAFSAYLAGGGRMLLLLDPTLAPAGGLVDLGLAGWLAGYGVRLDDDIVLDPEKSVPFFGAQTFAVDAYGDHPVVDALSRARLPVLVALARSVRAAEDAGRYQVTELLETGAEGWGEKGLDRLDGELAPDGDDLRGPVALGVAVVAADGGADAAGGWEGEEGEGGAADGGGAGDAGAAAEGGEAEAGGPAGAAEGEGGEGEAGAGAEPAAIPAGETADGDEGAAAAASGTGMRMVVIGDSELAADAYLTSGAGNAAFLDNAMNWLLARETQLGIPPKKPQQVRLDLSWEQLLRIYLLTALLPLLAVVGGVAVYLRRRR